jgi:hypothetical protein
MSRLKDLTNKKFNMLKVLHRAGSNRQGSSTWLCKCDCGNKKVFSSDHLTRKNYPVKSCGCIKKSRKGKDHPLWKGFGEISGNWWFNHVVRERTQTARPKVEVKITIRQAWNLYIKQNRKCVLSGLEINFDNVGAYNTASLGT